MQLEEVDFLDLASKIKVSKTHLTSTQANFMLFERTITLGSHFAPSGYNSWHSTQMVPSLDCMAHEDPSSQ